MWFMSNKHYTYHKCVLPMKECPMCVRVVLAGLPCMNKRDNAGNVMIITHLEKQ